MLTIDHIVICVHDLQAAIETYRQLGFNAHYGGQHADGLTENGLVIFADDTYLELIALTEGTNREDATFKQLVRADEGYTGYALQSDDLEADVARITQGAIPLDMIRDGSRTRTDGEVLKWRMAQVDDLMSPFVIQDVTQRNKRVPANGETVVHENGAQGIADVHLLVADLHTGMTRYEALTGTTPTADAQHAVFTLGDATITLSEPVDDAQQTYLDQYGSVPFQLTLNASVPNVPILPDAANGARFVFK